MITKLGLVRNKTTFIDWWNRQKVDMVHEGEWSTLLKVMQQHLLQTLKQVSQSYSTKAWIFQKSRPSRSNIQTHIFKSHIFSCENGAKTIIITVGTKHQIILGNVFLRWQSGCVCGVCVIMCEWVWLVCVWIVICGCGCVGRSMYVCVSVLTCLNSCLCECTYMNLNM